MQHGDTPCAVHLCPMAGHLALSREWQRWRLLETTGLFLDYSGYGTQKQRSRQPVFQTGRLYGQPGVSDNPEHQLAGDGGTSRSRYNAANEIAAYGIPTMRPTTSKTCFLASLWTIMPLRAGTPVQLWRTALRSQFNDWAPTGIPYRWRAFIWELRSPSKVPMVCYYPARWRRLTPVALPGPAIFNMPESTAAVVVLDQHQYRLCANRLPGE